MVSFVQGFTYEKDALKAVNDLHVFNAKLHLLTTMMDDDQTWLSLKGKQDGVTKQGILRAISYISAVVGEMIERKRNGNTNPRGYIIGNYIVSYTEESDFDMMIKVVK